MDLATLNRPQTENEINKTLFGLQEASPFPKLPPYFVHQVEGGDTHDTGSNRLRSTQKRGEGTVTNSRPPSGKSGVSIVTPSECGDSVEASQRSRGKIGQ